MRKSINILIACILLIATNLNAQDTGQYQKDLEKTVESFLQKTYTLPLYRPGKGRIVPAAKYNTSFLR